MKYDRNLRFYEIDILATHIMVTCRLLCSIESQI